MKRLPAEVEFLGEITTVNREEKCYVMNLYVEGQEARPLFACRVYGGFLPPENTLFSQPPERGNDAAVSAGISAVQGVDAVYDAFLQSQHFDRVADPLHREVVEMSRKDRNSLPSGQRRYRFLPKTREHTDHYTVFALLKGSDAERQGRQ